MSSGTHHQSNLYLQRILGCGVASSYEQLYHQILEAGKCVRQAPHYHHDDTDIEDLRDELMDEVSKRIFFEGKEPILPSQQPLASIGAISLGSVALALSRIRKLRNQQKSEGTSIADTDSCTISLRAAAAAIRSVAYCRPAYNPSSSSSSSPSSSASSSANSPNKAKNFPRLWDPISGLYRVGDGRFIQLHCNYPHHREIAVRVIQEMSNVENLVNEPTRETVARAIQSINNAEALEEEITNAGGCAAMVRSRNAWLEHPQRLALHTIPLVQITRCGDSEPIPLPPLVAGATPESTQKALSNIKVLDLTHVLAGPTASKTLAEHGAEVLTISAEHLPVVEAAVLDTGFGKRSAFLDLREKENLSQLEKLLEEADVVVQSFRPGSLESKFGLSASSIHQKIRPGVVVVSVSAYGGVGPWGDKRGFDTLVQCVSGVAQTQGDMFNPNAEPQHLPASVLDYCTGFLGAFGALVALEHRAKYGGSYSVEVSLAKTCEWMQEEFWTPLTSSTPRGARSPRYPSTAYTEKVMTNEDIKDLLVQTQTEYGVVEHLGPVIRFEHDKKPAELISRPRGSDEPVWSSQP